MPYFPDKQDRPWIPKPLSKRDKVRDKIYEGMQWRNFRKSKLMVDPLCEECKRNNRVVEASVVDHIERIKDGGEVYSMDNVQSLCKPCHARKSSNERADRREGGANC